MEFAFDFYLVNEYSDAGIILPQSFIYDERRYCSKLYVFLKLMGLITYISTLTRCYNPNFYTTMIVVMFLSTLNSLRYEHKHLQRYGTTFSSINEYDVWKRGLWPKSRLVFSMIELGIKVWYFINTFPPQFEFNNRCNIGDSIFKIHTLVLFVIYIFIALLTICLLSTTYCYTSSRPPVVIQNINIASPIHITTPIPISVINNQNEECCICLDNNNNQVWSMLSCGHKFHDSCISSWLLRQQRCPVCRHAMVNT